MELERNHRSRAMRAARRKKFIYFSFVTYRFPLLIAFFCLLFTTYRLPLTHAAFDDFYWSARVASLGGAFTALSNDPTGIFYNAAAGIRVRSKQANFSYARLFHGLDNVNFSLSQFAYTHPLNRTVSLGIGWGNFNSLRLYREDTLILSYARRMDGMFENFKGDIAFAVTGRFLFRRFVLDDRSAADPVFSEKNRIQTGTFDLHFYSLPDPENFPGLSIGMSVKSILQPDIGFREEQRLNREITGGILYSWKNFSFPLDFSGRGNEILSRMGVETSLLDDRFILRFGSDRSQVGSGFGYQHQFSDRFSVVLDYAFLWPLRLKGTFGSHRATFGVKF